MALPGITITNATVVADPELRYTQDGTAVTTVRVASNSRRKNRQTGEWENAATTFLNVVAFDSLAENVATSFQKGSKINATGTLAQNDWEKDGVKRTSYDLRANDIAIPVSRYVDSPSQQITANTDPFAATPSSDEPPF